MQTFDPTCKYEHWKSIPFWYKNRSKDTPNLSAIDWQVSPSHTSYWSPILQVMTGKVVGLENSLSEWSCYITMRMWQWLRIKIAVDAFDSLWWSWVCRISAVWVVTWICSAWWKQRSKRWLINPSITVLRSEHTCLILKITVWTIFRRAARNLGKTILIAVLSKR